MVYRRAHRDLFLQIGLRIHRDLVAQWKRHQTEVLYGCPGVDWSRDLCGACAVAATLVFRQLRLHRFNPRLVVTPTENHVYCTVGHVVIDATATQFDSKYPKVVVGTRRDLARWLGTSVYWEVGEVFETEEELDAALAEWPDGQRPRSVLILLGAKVA